MFRTLIVALCCLATPAVAQVSQPTGVDLSTFARTSDVAAAQQTAAAAAAAAAAACVATPAVPGMEAVGGAAGTNNGQCRPVNSVQPRISRTVSGTTGAAGTVAVTWTDMGAVPKLTVTPYIASTATNVPTCYPVTGTVTSTGATIKCYITQSILGLGLVPFTTATAGIIVDVLALPAS